MDLDSLFKRAFDGFGNPNASEFPGFPGAENPSGKDQYIENISISRCSRISRSETVGIGSDELLEAEKTACFLGEDRANVSPQKTPGNPGNPGKEEKSFADTGTYHFPEKIEKTGNPGNESSACERPILDLNRAGPQRGDWWDGDHLAALAPQLVPAPVLDESLPIAPAEVRAGVERELRALAALGRTGPDVLRNAIELTRAKVRNSEALAERQANGGRCHVCDEALDDSLPVVAVLTGKNGAHIWLHSDCHAEHSRRMAAKVERVMAAAGFGADRRLDRTG